MKNPPQARVFRYAHPGRQVAKTVVKLARTDRMIAMVQVLKHGGENNLHSHRHLDGFWFVLKGRAIFYGEGDRVLASLGPHEGILVPRNFKSWFESSGEEDLELLQVEAFDIPLPDDQSLLRDRINHSELKPSFADMEIIEGSDAGQES
jgi:mannose-6-phosphate isomerase-like protein (cupin superfamily)